MPYVHLDRSIHIILGIVQTYINHIVSIIPLHNNTYTVI